MKDKISRIPSLADRVFQRIDAQVYFYCEPVELDGGNTQDHVDFSIPTFVQEEDDFVGLSIDAFKEQVLEECPPNKDYYLRLQQLLSMFKRFSDTQTTSGNKQTTYKKLKVNISGSGLAFPSDVAYHAGQVLRLYLFFFQHPFTHVSFVSEVVRSEKAEIGYDIKVQYKEISQKCRDEILRFVNYHLQTKENL